jgi:hypothetical protein
MFYGLDDNILQYIASEYLKNRPLLRATSPATRPRAAPALDDPAPPHSKESTVQFGGGFDEGSRWCQPVRRVAQARPGAIMAAPYCTTLRTLRLEQQAANDEEGRNGRAKRGADR